MEQGRSYNDYSDAPREELVVVREILNDIFTDYPECSITEHLPATDNVLATIKETVLLKTTQGRYVISKLSSEGKPAIFTINLYDLENMCRLDNDKGGNDIKLIQYIIYSDQHAIYACNSRAKLPFTHKYMSELNAQGASIITELLTDEFEEIATRDELRYLLLLQQKADELESTHGDLSPMGRR